MLILLPPSESKAVPGRGKPLDLAALSFPALTATRERVLDTLVDLCRNDPERARTVLGLTPGLASEVGTNARIREAPTARASRIYTGVLYDALALTDLDAAAGRRAAHRIAVTSAVYGLVRPGDRIAPYRLSGNVTLPGLGTVAGTWRGPMADVLDEIARRSLVVDLRSGTYAAFWRPAGRLQRRVARVRVLHESEGRRSVVSHFNKATKGRLTASLLRDAAAPRTPQDLADHLRTLGWKVETAGDPSRLDVVVTDL